nr:MarR family transcriptional regulator [Halomicroarcula salinisoli]
MTGYIEPAPHEFSANFLFDENGLAPYFAADSRVKAGDGSQVAEFTDQGEQWIVKLYFQESNIVHPGTRLPTGTEWRLHEMREFRLKVARHPDEDPVGEQDFNAHLAPRWQGMKTENKYGNVSEHSVPEPIIEAINVKIAGSNIEFARYQRLLQSAAAAVRVRGDYFEVPHEYSNIQDAERYVRLAKETSGPVHARDGPIASMAHLLENDRAGYRKVVQNDDDEYGRNLPGYYHTVTLGPRRVREVFPDHALPKEIKHYYARHALSQSGDSPLAHPKVGVSYQVSRWNETLGVTPDDLDQLQRELDQTLLSVLADAGLDIAPTHGTGIFVTDAYFDAKTTESGPEVIALDVTEIRSTQESVVIRHLADGLSPVQWESLQTLVTDGGEVSPADIADEHGRHVESVRRALRGIEDLVEREYARVSLRSSHIADLVHQAVTEAEDAVKRAAEAGAKAVRTAQQGMDETMSVFIAWAARHGIDIDDALSRREARMEMRFGAPGQRAGRVIREGFEIWEDAGLPAQRYRMARIRFSDGSLANAWQYLNPG